MQEKIEELKIQVKALKNSNVMSVVSMKHNATLAVAMAVDIIEEQAAKIAKIERAVSRLKKEAKANG
jgi:hypothetical protein